MGQKGVEKEKFLVSSFVSFALETCCFVLLSGARWSVRSQKTRAILKDEKVIKDKVVKNL